jgi:hypothetical protein
MRRSIESGIETARFGTIDFRFRVLSIFVLVALIGACGPASKAPPLDLPIYFTCDTDGRLQPCGCFTGQYGGLSRLKTVLDQEAPDEALRVDVGDAISGHEDYDLIEYGYVLDAYAAMKFDAMNIGQREAHLSAAQLHHLKETSPVPILSANLLDQSNGQPIFDSYRIVQRGDYRIALVGVIDPRGMERDLGEGLAIGDMETAIERCLAELRDQADVVVLLAFTDQATLARLADQFYECQVILGGKVTQPAQHPMIENRSVISYVTNESRALGILRLKIARDAPLEVTASEIRLMRDSIAQDTSISDLVQAYRKKVRYTKLSVDDPHNLSADMVPGVRTLATYVGTEKCISCHQTAAAIWKTSAHARAFATLLTHGADADPKCIGCHTVGFGEISGYSREFGATKLVNVGCESCHGPGSLHVAEKEGDTSINFTFRPLDAGDCMKCHQGEFSRPFKWDLFWPVIQHGKEPSPSGPQPHAPH